MHMVVTMRRVLAAAAAALTLALAAPARAQFAAGFNPSPVFSGATLDTAAGSPASTGFSVQGFGSAGTPGGGLLTVQGAASMTPLLSVLQSGSNTVGKIDVLGNAGGVFDKLATGSASANSIQIEGVASGTPVPTNVTQVGGASLALGAAATTASLPVVSATLSHASVTSLGTSLLVKSSAGNLGAYNCTAITGGAAGYCVAYNSASVPSTGALTGANVLSVCQFDTSAKGCNLSRLPNSIAFSAGIVVLVTTAASPFTYTTGTDTAFVEADNF